MNGVSMGLQKVLGPGVLARSRQGEPMNIGTLVLHPEKVNETHWTGRKFHGYLTKHCQEEVGYSTLMRWLHDEGFRLKVPRPWPDGQDEKRGRPTSN